MGRKLPVWELGKDAWLEAGVISYSVTAYTRLRCVLAQDSQLGAPFPCMETFRITAQYCLCMLPSWAREIQAPDLCSLSG